LAIDFCTIFFFKHLRHRFKINFWKSKRIRLRRALFQQWKASTFIFTANSSARYFKYLWCRQSRKMFDLSLKLESVEIT
jgi:hypothetical protein